jgi:DNA-binding transcriptional regulator YhcF (GntR family)
MTLTTRPFTKAQATRALYDAIDEAALAGRSTPCRLSHAFDAEDLDHATAAKLVHRCRTECPVLRQCTDRALLLTADAKLGSVLAGTYYPPFKPTRWQLVYDDLRDRIEAGEYAPGERLPSLTVLARASRVHGNVVRAALDHLERNGLLAPDGDNCYVVDAYGSILGGRQAAIEEPQPDSALDARHDIERVA